MQIPLVMPLQYVGDPHVRTRAATSAVSERAKALRQAAMAGGLIQGWPTQPNSWWLS